VLEVFLQTSLQLKQDDPEVPIPRSFSRHWLPRTISKAQKGAGGLINVAELDGKVVGFVLALKGRKAPWDNTKKATCFVMELQVSPAFQGKGIGGLLLASVEKEYRKRGYDWISLGVFPLNRRARSFYAKAGYGERYMFLGKVLR
jgi:ribosomal protein S18 acetylase RimI-like enzyme